MHQVSPSSSHGSSTPNPPPSLPHLHPGTPPPPPLPPPPIPRGGGPAGASQVLPPPPPGGPLHTPREVGSAPWREDDALTPTPWREVEQGALTPTPRGRGAWRAPQEGREVGEDSRSGHVTYRGFVYKTQLETCLFPRLGWGQHSPGNQSMANYTHITLGPC